MSFPIFIFNNEDVGTVQWREIFPEASVERSLQRVYEKICMSEEGGLVISASSFTSMTRECLLELVEKTKEINNVKDFNGFFIDNIYAQYPLTREIARIHPRQVLQLSSRRNAYQQLVPMEQRSYWMTSEAARKFLKEIHGETHGEEKECEEKKKEKKCDCEKDVPVEDMPVEGLIGQLYPSAVIVATTFPRQNNVMLWMIILIVIILFIAVFYWLAVIIL